MTRKASIFWLAVFSCLLIEFVYVKAFEKAEDGRLLVVTVATEETDGLKRLRESAEEFGHELEVINRIVT